MSWAPNVKTSQKTEYTAELLLSFTSRNSVSDAELGLVRVLRRAADDIERDVDKRRSVMAP